MPRCRFLLQPGEDNGRPEIGQSRIFPPRENVVFEVAGVPFSGWFCDKRLSGRALLKFVRPPQLRELPKDNLAGVFGYDGSLHRRFGSSWSRVLAGKELIAFETRLLQRKATFASARTDGMKKLCFGEWLWRPRVSRWTYHPDLSIWHW